MLNYCNILYRLREINLLELHTVIVNINKDTLSLFTCKT